jgi:hypothetical protein
VGLLLAAVVAVVGATLVVAKGRGARRAERESGVASFRRHMDALSPEARRKVIERVGQARHRDRRTER